MRRENENQPINIKVETIQDDKNGGYVVVVKTEEEKAKKKVSDSDAKQ